jgi:baculoviral IAP repeat-containing protein 2/3
MNVFVAAELRNECAMYEARSDARPTSADNVMTTTDTLEKEVDVYLVKMKYKHLRLRTFAAVKWPITSTDPRELAKAGFFNRMSRANSVQCAFCRVIISGWGVDDVPLEKHKRLSMSCPFLREYNYVANAPNQIETIRGNRFNIAPRRSHTRQIPQLSTMDMKRYGVYPHAGPVHKDFASLDSRIMSFATCGNWPKNSPMLPKELALAGFYYVGRTDYVTCFYCGLGLCDWVKGDEPWSQHCGWFSDCHYVRLNKGEAFIESCRYNPGRDKAQCELVGNAGNLNPTVAQTLALEAVETWLKGDIVLQLGLEDGYSFSKNVIKSVLYQRWLKTQRPFESPKDFFEAVSSANRNLFGKNVGPPSCKSENGETTAGKPETTPCVSRPMSGPSQSSYALDENKLVCKVCLDQQIGVVFLPCGHFVTCTLCAPGLSDCPVCRVEIKGSVRTFVS